MEQLPRANLLFLPKNGHTQAEDTPILLAKTAEAKDVCVVELQKDDRGYFLITKQSGASITKRVTTKWAEDAFAEFLKEASDVTARHPIQVNQEFACSLPLQMVCNAFTEGKPAPKVLIELADEEHEELVAVAWFHDATKVLLLFAEKTSDYRKHFNVEQSGIMPTAPKDLKAHALAQVDQYADCTNHEGLRKFTSKCLAENVAGIYVFTPIPDEPE